MTNCVEKATARKLVHPAHLDGLGDLVRAQGHTLATLNGSFDLLHAGHLYILMEAAKQADRLLVALNSDASVRRYKSTDRPIIPLESRIQLVAALECVDLVTWFDEDDPRVLLSRVRPNVHVNGAEYGQACIEADTVRQHGGRLHLVDRIPGLSTTEILDKVSRLCVSSAHSTTTNRG